jgi:phage terminase large subunit GpA-like protein
MLKKAIDLLKEASKYWAPPPDLTVSEWADTYRQLSREASAEPGNWRTSRAPYFREIMNATKEKGVQKVIVKSCSQVGKALSLDTPILTTHGFETMGSIRKGDVVFDENGKQCNVTFVSRVMLNRKLYNVKFSDGSVIKADHDHVWTVNVLRGESENLTTGDMIERGIKYGAYNRFSIPTVKPLQTEHKDLPIDPYTLGVWLGDGHSRCGIITAHSDDVDCYVSNITDAGHECDVRFSDERNKNIASIHIDGKASIKNRETCIRGHKKSEVGLTKLGYCAECARQYALKHKHNDNSRLDDRAEDLGTFTWLLRCNDLIKNKHVPDDYMMASNGQRLSLLQGLMDTDGTITKSGRCEFSNNSKHLCESVYHLLVSLGYKPTIKSKSVKGYTDYEHYRVSFTAYSELPVFRLRRKIERLKSQGDHNTRCSETFNRRIVSITEIESEPVRCIQVDSDSHLFLAGRSLIPTHNTELILNLIGYFAHNDPSPIMLVQPTVEMAEAFSKDRLAPAIRDSDVLKEIFPDPKSRNAGNTLRHKSFPGGHISLIGANAPSSLASRPIRVLLCDEINRYPISAGSEGNPVKLAEARTSTFYNKLICLVSTPTTKGECEISKHYEGSSQGKYHLLCPECDAPNYIDRKILSWQKDEDGNIKQVDAVCRECGAISSEIKWKKREGVYIHADPHNKIRGFWLNAYASTFRTWLEIEKEFQVACKNTEDLKVFVNTVLAEEWEERGEQVGFEDLLVRRESYTEVPEQAALLTAAIDTQDDRLECEVVAWGEGDESWHVDYQVFYGDPSKPELWRQMANFIEHKRYKSQLGYDLGVTATCIDLQGHHTQRVYEFCDMMRPLKVWPVRGVGGEGKQLIKKGKSKIGRVGRDITIYNVAVDQAKLWVHRRLKQKESGPGYCHFPMSVGEEYFKGLTAEKLIQRMKNGRMVSEWVLGSHKRNEPLDLRVYNYACIRMLNPVYASIMANMKPAQKYNDSTPQAAPPRRKKKRRGVLSKGI